MSEQAWHRFLRHARAVLARSTFDEGYRDWKPHVAKEVRILLDTERDSDRWIAALEAIVPVRQDFRDYRYDLPTPGQANWLKRWARMDPTSLWRAFDGYAEAAGDPVERFTLFAKGVENAPDETRVSRAGVITMGSLFNFSLAPEALPIIRTGPFGAVERALDFDPKADAPAVEVYANHLDFAGRVRERMEREGLPIRDMIDVQSLITITGYEIDYWAHEEPRKVRVERERAHVGVGSKPYLSICAIYRDEAPNLREWIEFHRLVGVERFFLYDNRSSDNHLEVLAPYIENGIVVHHDWPLFPGQFAAYDHCVSEHRYDSRWIAIQDMDEFLFSPTGATVSEMLADYERHPAVGVNMMMFGTSGHRIKPSGLVIEEHTWRDVMPWPFIKNIVDPTRVVRCLNAHSFAYDFRTAVDENHQPIIQKRGRTQFTSTARLRINHYYFKSEDEGRAKLAKPMAIGGTRPFDFETLDRELNAELDETIVRYVPAVREALAKPASESRGVSGSRASS